MAYFYRAARRGTILKLKKRWLLAKKRRTACLLNSAGGAAERSPSLHLSSDRAYTHTSYDYRELFKARYAEPRVGISGRYFQVQ